jgi:hypothetical protein
MIFYYAQINNPKPQDELFATNFPAKGVIEEAASVREKKKHMKPLEAEQFEDSLHVLMSKYAEIKTVPEMLVRGKIQQPPPVPAAQIQRNPRLSRPLDFINPSSNQQVPPNQQTTFSKYWNRTERGIRMKNNDNMTG